MFNQHLTLLNTKLNQFQQGHTPADLLLLKALFDLLEIHFREVRQPSFYTTTLKTTPFRLNGLLAAHFNCSLYQLMQSRIHEEALNLLKYTTLTVREIAFELGMADPSYFCRCFRRITGLSPKQYREGLKITVLF